MTGNIFKVLREIGTGSYGVVDVVDYGGNIVARKRLRVDSLGTPKYRDRFRREAEIMRQLRHQNVMPILDAELEGDGPWFTMPCMDRNLGREVLPTVGLSPVRIESIFNQILDAVEHAHEQGVLHRDLSPNNVLLKDNLVVVSDFGLGRRKEFSGVLTSIGERGGTPGYTAPEQWDNLHAATERSDVYSLGSILFFMATGRSPLAIAPALLPERFHHIIRKCRREDPAKRYSSVAELAADFDAAWRPAAEEHSPRERAESLLASQKQDEETFEQIASLYLRNPGDVDLYRVTLPLWPNSLLTKLEDGDHEAFVEIVTLFDGHVDGHLPFEYVDVATNFLERVFHLADDDLRELALRRILIMGERHNRFHARRVLARIASGARAPAEILTIRRVLLNNRTEAAWVAEELLGRSISPLIRQLLEEATGVTSGLALIAPVAPPKLAASVTRPFHLPRQKVIHPKFGRGMVVRVMERENDQEVVVDFQLHGRKRLIASLARLEVVAS